MSPDHDFFLPPSTTTLWPSTPTTTHDPNLPTMTSSPAHLRSLYRAILRELPPRPVLATPRTPLHAHLRASLAAPSGADASPAVAAELVTYLRAQRTYATLLERYNPGMGMDEAERVRLSARRVGMDLPVLVKGRL
ncbi:Ras guanyl-nucleotide exchange factor [Cordyceps militaris]|uniref:Ras guanyl-nucleotide exchange factor n=1 Tax=Cordyceps militaris TaxID=73501 RepID=A0A2H4SV90_CORMI|nr:Ras guanyl-nucleotide exchange factor [Cordyceps militaris]